VLFDAIVDGQTIRMEVREQNGRYRVSLDSRILEVDYAETGRDFVSLLMDGRSHEVGLSPKGRGYSIVLEGDAFEVTFEDAIRGAARPDKGRARAASVVAPMPGRVLRVLVSSGDDVAEGQALLVMEAMKMENELRAPRSGRIGDLPVREGQTVETGALLAVVE
jgi:biotin carboxyl carrier protein